MGLWEDKIGPGYCASQSPTSPLLHLAVADVEEALMGEKPGSECQKILLSAAGAWPPGLFGLPKRRHQKSKP